MDVAAMMCYGRPLWGATLSAYREVGRVEAVERLVSLATMKLTMVIDGGAPKVADLRGSARLAVFAARVYCEVVEGSFASEYVASYMGTLMGLSDDRAHQCVRTRPEPALALAAMRLWQQEGAIGELVKALAEEEQTLSIGERGEGAAQCMLLWAYDQVVGDGWKESNGLLVSVGDLLKKFGVNRSSRCHVSKRMWRKAEVGEQKAAAGKRSKMMVKLGEVQKVVREVRLGKVASEETMANEKQRSMAKMLLETMELGFVSLLQFVRVYVSGRVTKRSMEEAARRGCGMVLPAGAQGADLVIPVFKFRRCDVHRAGGRQRVKPSVKVTMEHMTTLLVVQVKNQVNAPMNAGCATPQNLGPHLSSSCVWEMSTCPELQAMACVGMYMSMRSGGRTDSYVTVGGAEEHDIISYANVVVGVKALKAPLKGALYQSLWPLIFPEKVEPERLAVSSSMPEFVSQCPK
jgi:hypothetical protein